MACVGMFFFNCSIMSFSSSSIEWEKHNQKLAALFSLNNISSEAASMVL
jgi:hypothetical protein